MSCCETSTTTGFAFDSPASAMEALCDLVSPVGTEAVAWDHAAGRVLACDAVSDRPSPSCDVSAMDGYVLRMEDCIAGRIEVSGEVHIGEQPPDIQVGKALLIVTGAPIPDGGEVVIKRENVIEHPDSIELPGGLVQSVKGGANIRRVGENMSDGTIISCTGRRVTAPVMGMLTGFGISEPAVYKQVRLGIITTGNEVVTPDRMPSEWQLRDSNSSAIIAMCDQHRWIKVHSRIHARDSIESIRSVAEELTKTCDALVFTGGVSMGDHDHVPAIVESLDSRTVFHKLPQRPGKPALGAVLSGKPILGLPGNPVSVMVTAHRLLMPALAIRAGIQGPIATPRMVRVINADTKTLGMWWNRLVRVIGDDEVELIWSKGSGDVPNAALSDGFIELAPGQSGEGPWAFWSWAD